LRREEEEEEEEGGGGERRRRGEHKPVRPMSLKDGRLIVLLPPPPPLLLLSPLLPLLLLLLLLTPVKSSPFIPLSPIAESWRHGIRLVEGNGPDLWVS